MIIKSFDSKKGIKRLFIGKNFGLIFGWSIKAKDYFYDKNPGDKPWIWFENYIGKIVNTKCLYIMRFYIALFKKKDILKKLKQKFIDYWFGYVGIIKNYVYCLDNKNRLESFDIWVGKNGKGNLFSNIEIKNINILIKSIKNNDKKYFNLHLNLGYGAYQDYIFNKYQQKLLLEKLEELIKEDFYFEEDC